MKTSCLCEFKLTKSLGKKAKEEVVAFLNNIEKDLQKKIKSREMRLSKISFLKNKILFSISSKGRVRGYSYLLYLRNQLTDLLGKKFKVGIKEVICKSLTIDLTTSRKPKEKIKLPFIKKISFKDKTAHLEFEELNQTALSENYVDRVLKLLEGKIAAQYITGKAATEKVVRKSKEKLNKYVFKEDPTPEIISRGWVREFPGPGVWIIMPPLAALHRAIYNLIMDKIAEPLGFSEIMLPRLIPLDVARKQGKLSGIPYEMLWVCPPAKRDPKFFEKFTDFVKVTEKNAPEELAKYLDKPLFGLSHGQCEPFYQIFEKEIVDAEKLPIKVVDINGPTWRWEGGGLKGLERVTEFQRIEFVYLGTKEQVLKIRNQILKKSEEIMDKIFDVQYRIDANIPVYLEHAGEVEKKDEGFVKTYDLTIILPFQTASRPEAELEISSYHAHTDYYVKRFHIKEKKGRELWTGCAGLSPTRWAYVFLVRWGFDYKKWPREIKKYIGKDLPKTFDLITWPKKK